MIDFASSLGHFPGLENYNAKQAYLFDTFTNENMNAMMEQKFYLSKLPYAKTYFLPIHSDFVHAQLIPRK